MGDSWYDVAQVCPNGHVTNSCYRSNPENNQTYCGECGEKTITSCPTCGKEIRGYCHVPGAYFSYTFQPEKFCITCGSPYPWTSRKLEAANLLIEEMDLKDDEKKQLEESVEELVKNGPNTQVATLRYKKIIAKVGREAGGMLKDIITDIISETIKKTLFGA